MSTRIGNYIRQQHLALLTLFLVLAGGTAYATHPGGANTISSADIINGEVRSPDVGNNQVQSADVRDDTLSAGGLTAADLGPASAGFSELDPAAFLAGDIAPSGSAYAVANDAIQTGEITNETITGSDVADGSLGSAEIANGSLTGVDVNEASLGLGSAYAERTADLTLTTSYQRVLEADVNLGSGGRIMAIASLELDGDGGDDDHAFCYIEIDGANGPLYGHTIPGTLGDRATISLLFARGGFPGLHSVDLWCKRNLDPAVAVTDAGLIVETLPL